MFIGVGHSWTYVSSIGLHISGPTCIISYPLNKHYIIAQSILSIFFFFGQNNLLSIWISTLTLFINSHLFINSDSSLNHSKSLQKSNQISFWRWIFISPSMAQNCEKCHIKMWPYTFGWINSPLQQVSFNK